VPRSARCCSAGCAGDEVREAPVYVVQPQDTLYSIAWRHNLDYRDLAQLESYRTGISNRGRPEPRARSAGRGRCAATATATAPARTAQGAREQPRAGRAARPTQRDPALELGLADRSECRSAPRAERRHPISRAIGPGRARRGRGPRRLHRQRHSRLRPTRDHQAQRRVAFGVRLQPARSSSARAKRSRPARRSRTWVRVRTKRRALFRNPLSTASRSIRLPFLMGKNDAKSKF
jgi:hypothetical protein